MMGFPVYVYMCYMYGMYMCVLVTSYECVSCQSTDVMKFVVGYIGAITSACSIAVS